MDAIDTIRSEIKHKQGELNKLQERLEEFKKLQVIVSQIPQIENDLQALERTLAILLKHERPDTIPMPPTTFKIVMPPENLFSSLPDLAYSVLKEAGKPLSIDQIIPLILAKGRNVKSHSLRGSLYAKIKENKIFKLTSPGKFGLLEWENKKS